MARTIPAVTRATLENPNSEDALLFFATITHPKMTETIRLVTDGVDYVRDGNTWYRSDFAIIPLTDTDRPPRLKFSFPNVDREGVVQLRKIDGPATIKLEIISTVYFNLNVDPRTVKSGETVVATWEADQLYFVDVEINGLTVSGTLFRFDPSIEIWPNMLATKDLLPGLYAR